MANWQDPQTTGVGAASVSVPRAARDVGLRSYMLSVYNYMASGVLLTGIVAMLFANSSLINLVVNPATGQATPLFWIALFAPLGIVFALSFGINRISAGTAQLLFWLYAALVGVQFSSLFLVYTGVSIAQTFFAVAAAFLGLSLYGYTTKRDLSGFRTFLVMGVFGILIAMLINMFLRSPAMDLAISAIGVLVFAGLTAYDTQKIKRSDGQDRGHGRASALPRLHQHVPVPVEVHGRPPLATGNGRRSEKRKGPEERILRPFSFGGNSGPAMGSSGRWQDRFVQAAGG